MSETKTVDYVFREHNGQLEFVGDFDGFYQNVENPWDQDGNTPERQEFYDLARNQLIEGVHSILHEKRVEGSYSVIEVGCGLGYVLDAIRKSPYSGVKMDFSGLDVSSVATQKASQLFPGITFRAGDICQSNSVEDLRESFDCVILGQTLWYLLDGLDMAFHNMIQMVKPSGHLVISAGFYADQRYGTDVIDGFDGLLDYYLRRWKHAIRLTHASINYDCAQLGYPALLVFEKTY